MAVELRCMSRPCGRMNVLRLLLPTDGSKLTNANNLVDSCIVVPPGMRSYGQVHSRGPGSQGSYLVDPASSHMLVSKIKPCMSKYKLLYTVKLRMAH